MPKPLPFLFVALLAAGCTDPAGTPDVTPETPAAETEAANLTFDPARPVMAIPNTGHEAFIAVSPDGQTILSCAHGDFRAPAHMYASTDGGATFTELDAGPTMVPAGDCEVALGPEDAWTFSGKTALGITVATTKDQGETWIVNHAAGPPLNGLADRQWLTYVDSTLLLVYQPGTQTVGPILAARSSDFGQTFSRPEPVAAPDPGAPALTVGDFLLGPDGSVRIPLSREPAAPAGSARFSFLVSTDAGLTWTEQQAIEVPAGAYPTAAAVGNASIAWAFTDGASVQLAVSLDGGSTWKAPVEIATGSLHERPWASARPDGTVDVLWLSDGTQQGLNASGLAVTRIDPLAAQPVLGHAIAADIAFIEFASIAHDASGRAHVATTDAPRVVSGDPQLSEGLEGELLLVQERVTG